MKIIFERICEEVTFQPTVSAAYAAVCFVRGTESAFELDAAALASMKPGLDAQ